MSDIEKFCIWGNHSSTMVPDLTQATINGKAASGLVDAKWVDGEFTPVVQ